MASVVHTRPHCLESTRRGADPSGALERYPEYRTQPKALREVVSLIHPLAEDVTPSRAWRESIRARLLELRVTTRKAGQDPTKDEPVGGRPIASGFPGGADIVEVTSVKTLMNRR